jgi:hypothetical protein
LCVTHSNGPHGWKESCRRAPSISNQLQTWRGTDRSR